MSNEATVYNAHRAAQDKRIYFLLAAAGAAIAFAVTQTQGAVLHWGHLPLGAAVLLWAVSFVAGYIHLEYVESNLYANMDLLKVQGGIDPLSGNNKERMKIGVAVIKNAIERNSKSARLYSGMQFHCLLFGAMFYVGWHVFEMYQRAQVMRLPH